MKPMTLKNHQKSIYQVDAFTAEAFKGNPAGVVFADATMETDFMQKFAAEMNLSETAYIFDGDGCFNIRFFTPFSEVPLCGHASLAAAHVLIEKGIVDKNETILFKTHKYDISFSKKGDYLLMNLPVYAINKAEITKEFHDLTGLSPAELYKSEHGWHLAFFDDKADIIRAHPHLQHMRHSEYGNLIVTAKGEKNDDYDFVYRCFAPALGIDEDPVTGSAQCALVPFWKLKTGKSLFKSYQASQRKGRIEASFIDPQTIQIKGKAITIFEGKLML
jgi:PhzF family phenazine biosynthesis protein